MLNCCSFNNSGFRVNVQLDKEETAMLMSLQEETEQVEKEKEKENGHP